MIKEDRTFYREIGKSAAWVARPEWARSEGIRTRLSAAGHAG